MAEADDSDMLMFFVAQPGGEPLDAESASQLVPGDKLTADFKPGKYFEAEDFSFGIELDDDEGDVATPSSDQRSFARWRVLKPGTPKPTPPFKAEPGDVSITRPIDKSSPLLMKYCLDTHRFDKAVLVKRARSAKAGALAGVLRFEFSKVWLKAIEWENGDTVRETCKFKYESVKVTYVKRKPDGTVASTWPCSWRAVTHG